MLLFSKLYDVLIKTFLEYEKSSIQELHKNVNKEYKISLPNLYKVIAQLLDNQILVKEWWKISLHKRRILEFCEIADDIKWKHLQPSLRHIDLKEGEIITYEANSIKDIDGVRWDVFLAVHRIHNKPEPMYVYHAHPYYALGMKETEMTFFLQAQKISQNVYLLFSDTSFLDKYWSELYKKEGMKNVAVSNNHPFLKDGYCVNVVGDYVFEFLYPKTISEYFKVFFESVHNIKQFNTELFKKIFEMKWTCKLTVRRDSNQARNITKVFQKEFDKKKK